MDKTEWMITENYWDYKVDNVLFTYNENEIEQNKINKNNAWLLFTPKFIPFYPRLLEMWLTINESLVFWFIDFYLQNSSDKFYFTNEQIWKLFWFWEQNTSLIIKKLKEKWFIDTSYRLKANWWKIRFIKNLYSDYKNFYSPTIKKFIDNNNKINNNNINIYENQNLENQNQEQSQDTNNSIPKQKDSNTHTKISELDIIKNSDDIRDIFDDDEIAQHKIQLKIILKMVELWYKVKKSKSDIEKEFERLKAKAKLYWLIQWDWNIAWNTFYQKIDKRFDWHTEKWKKVKNFKTSIIPFISK